MIKASAANPARPELGVLVDSQILAGLGAVRHARDVHGIAARDGLGQEPRIASRVLAPKLPRLGIEPEAFHDVQLFAVRQASVQHARREADGVDDEHVALPAADRMPGEARLDRLRMPGHAHVNRARDTEPAVLDRDCVAALRDTVDRLAAPFGDDAPEDAGHGVAVRDWTRRQRGPAGCGQIRRRPPDAARAAGGSHSQPPPAVSRPPRRARGLDLRLGLLRVAGTRYRPAGLEVAGLAHLLDLAERHQGTHLSARVRHHHLLLGPVARDVRLAVGQLLRPSAPADLAGATSCPYRSILEPSSKMRVLT